VVGWRRWIVCHRNGVVFNRNGHFHFGPWTSRIYQMGP
jgi:hypothetical protein